jgi:hypothetical protein
LYPFSLPGVKTFVKKAGKKNRESDNQVIRRWSSGSQETRIEHLASSINNYLPALHPGEGVVDVFPAGLAVPF